MDKVRSRAADLGRQGEEYAAKYLRKQGMRIRERNWRPSGRYRSLEVDIIAEHRDCLVFVEVKSRRDALGPGPEANFNRAKQTALIRASRLYCDQGGLWDRPCRFDLVCVTFAGETPRITHYADVIEFSQSMGGSNTAWQPW